MIINLIYGLGAAALAWWLMRQFATANPKVIAAALKRAGGAVVLAVAVLLAARGRFDMAILAGGVGAWLLGWGGLTPSWLRRRPVSRLRSALIEMAFEPSSGRLTGVVLAGPSMGRDLDTLDPAELEALVETCRTSDPEGLRLLEAYLDRRFPGRREDAQGHDHARPGLQPQPGAMTEQEAYQILGLEPGAGVEAVRQAHRTLMKRLHPDQGGSTYLATRVNQAKDVLLRRHR